jgi:hypothetical protein
LELTEALGQLVGLLLFRFRLLGTTSAISAMSSIHFSATLDRLRHGC